MLYRFLSVIANEPSKCTNVQSLKFDVVIEADPCFGLAAQVFRGNPGPYSEIQDHSEE